MTIAKGPPDEVVVAELELEEIELEELEDCKIDNALDDCITTEEVSLVEEVVVVFEAFGATVAPSAIRATKITTITMPTLAIIPTPLCEGVNEGQSPVSVLRLIGNITN
jgi:hypothetical protein